MVTTDQPADDTDSPLSPMTSAGAPVSFTALSPPEQGDALSGLAWVVAGIGPASSPTIAGVECPTVGDTDAWAVTSNSETGWYVLLSQDCDIVRDAATEPTVLIAPLVYVSEQEWQDLSRNGYSARRYAYPGSKFSGLPEGKQVAVDLAWTTSILKGSLQAAQVYAVRPLTGPNKATFSEWLSARTGRVPFPDDVVANALDPCYQVRNSLLTKFIKKGAGQAPLEARGVGAVERWFVHRDGKLVTFLGQVTGSRLKQAGFDAGDGSVNTVDLGKAQNKIESAILARMNQVNPSSGYQVRLVLADLSQVSAIQFVNFALLVR